VLERRCVARGNGAEGRRTKENEAAAAATVVAAAAAAAAAAAEVEEKVKVENSKGGRDDGLKVAGQSLTLFLCSY